MCLSQNKDLVSVDAWEYCRRLICASSSWWLAHSSCSSVRNFLSSRLKEGSEFGWNSKANLCTYRQKLYLSEILSRIVFGRGSSESSVDFLAGYQLLSFLSDLIYCTQYSLLTLLNYLKELLILLSCYSERWIPFFRFFSTPSSRQTLDCEKVICCWAERIFRQSKLFFPAKLDQIQRWWLDLDGKPFPCLQEAISLPPIPGANLLW